MQPLTEFQIELVDDADDRGRRARAQRFLDRPQGVVASRGFDQDQAFRIKPERGETMAVKPAMVAKAVSGQDAYDFTRPGRGRVGEHRKMRAGVGWCCAVVVDPTPMPRLRSASTLPLQGRVKEDMRQQRRDEAKGGGRGVRLGDDFMQRAAGEAAIGEARIQRGQPESENPVNIRRAGQQAAQFLHDGGAVARRGNDGELSHRHVQN
jgi:hypothetical protein